ncbi:MAG: ribbon-helix-helix domain-containing protein, partial [Burkholderiales bacterium]
ITDWIEAQIQPCAYASTSDFERDLIRRDREQKAHIDAIRKLIDESEASGIRSRKLDKIFAGARAIAKRRETRRDTE